MKKLIIDRKTWLRGAGGAQCVKPTTCLRDKETGHMCCLGFGMRQIDNIPEELLIDHCTPDGVDLTDGQIVESTFVSNLHEEIDACISKNNSLSIRAMEINDDGSLSEDVREAKLTDLFKNYNIEIEFVG